MFKNNQTKPALVRLIRNFLAEDLGRGDITGEAIFPPETMGRAQFIAKEEMVVAGIEELAPLVFAARSIAEAVRKVREYNRLNGPNRPTVEVECETIAQVEEALAAGVEIIMLDNMSPAMIRQAVALTRDRGRALLEASGGVRLDNVRAIAETGVDRISIGVLTHSAPAKDISMEIA